MKGKYPFSLFIIGFFLNLIVRFAVITLAAILFLITGIWSSVCLYIGLLLLLLSVGLSFVEQLKSRYLTLKSEDENFKEWQTAILSDDWQTAVKELTEEKIDQSEGQDDPDDPDKTNEK